MTAILYFIHNAISKVLSAYINISGITEIHNYTRHQNHVFSVENNIISLFHLVQMAAILDFLTFWLLK